MRHGLRVGWVFLCAFTCLSARAGDNSVENEFLLDAIAHGKTAQLREELSHGADPDARDAGGKPAVSLASLAGNLDAVCALLDAGARAFNEVHESGKVSGTPLSIATWSGRPDIAECLLKKGADFNVNHLDAWRGAVVRGSISIVHKLIDAGVDPNYRFPDGQSAIMVAAIRDNVDLVTLLLEHGGDINFRDNAGITPLMIAAANGHTAVVRLLLEKRAIAWPLNAFGENAVSAARHVTDPSAREATVALLLSHGAPAKARNREIDDQLLTAAHAGDLDQVKSLLGKGADIEARGEPNIKLWLRDVLSASVAHPIMCKFLISRGANVHRVDGAGFTPLHTAAMEGSAECIKALVAAGIDPNVQSRSRITPLYMAVNHARPDSTVAALLASGADPNSPGPSGGSLLTMARGRGLRQVAKDLLDAGAKE